MSADKGSTKLMMTMIVNPFAISQTASPVKMGATVLYATNDT